jgi:FtsP/CotA-like multicopper oxidase with cupredoxin domain
MRSLVSIAGLLVLMAIGGASVARGDSGGPCTRSTAGSVANNPTDLFSKKGVLSVELTYNTEVDADGRTLYCFTTPDGTESPTLHVRPGDHLIVNVTNNLKAPVVSNNLRMTMSAPDVCGASSMGPASVNMHFHGTNTSPECHQDEVIHTLINPGESFDYDLKFPKNEPPGLYWYHPHVHGIAEAAVLGGASGAIVVEGLQKIQPAVAGLAQKILVIRDQNVAGRPLPGGPNDVPSWDLTLNYVPIAYPDYTPAIVKIKRGEKQLWRVVNACADSIVDLQVQYDGKPQTLEVVGLDGVPTGSQDGTRKGKIVKVKDILLPTAARAEFIVTGPAKSVKNATLMTLNVDTGPIGDVDPERPLAALDTSKSVDSPVTSAPSATEELVMPTAGGAPGPQRFEGLADAMPTAQRTLYFSEMFEDARVPPIFWFNTAFFITVDGAVPRVFSPNNPPAITTTQGSVEDWTIQNRTQEVHEFHIHQIHFMLRAINGVPVPKEQQQLLDMVQVPYWTGTGDYPSVTVRMDFRGPDIGDFVYHCHILAHEDGGMMAIIRVLPRDTGWIEPLGKLRTLLASVRWANREEPAAWCESGRTIERPRNYGVARDGGAQALPIGLMFLIVGGALFWRRGL